MKAAPDPARGRPLVHLVIHDREQLRLALSAADAASCDLALLSPPDAALWLGAAAWRALLADAASLHPGVGRTDILDCGRAAGRAMEALRLGQTRLVLSPACPQFAAVLERATSLGASISTARPAAFDLGEFGASRHLAAHLRRRDDSGRGED